MDLICTYCLPLEECVPCLHIVDLRLEEEGGQRLQNLELFSIPHLTTSDIARLHA